VIGELGEWRFDEVHRIIDWPLDAGLVAFKAHLKREAWDKYRFDAIIYAAGGSHTAPRLPDILMDERQRRRRQRRGGEA
jgi:hypothetical protein